MKPKEILCQWVDAFNNADTEAIANLYDDNAINHQTGKPYSEVIDCIRYIGNYIVKENFYDIL